MTGWWDLYGAALFNTGQWKDCATAYGQAVLSGDNVPSSLVNQASCLGNLQQYEDSLKKLNRALQLNPSNKSINCVV